MKDFIDTLEEICSLYPAQTAVSEGSECIDYDELWKLSSRVYTCLNRKKIGPEDVVMLRMNTAIKTITACVGVLRAGAAFVIVGQDQDQEIIRNIYRVCDCRMRIDDPDFDEMLNETGISGYRTVSDHAPAYVIYTSGSTRKPKGVMLERGAMALCRESACFQGKKLVSAGDAVALVPPLTFAAGMIQLTITLSAGASLYVVSKDTMTSPSARARYFRENRITMSFMTPTLYRTFHEFNPEMKLIALGGEPVEDIVPPDFELYNMYGQSESGFIVALQRIHQPQQEAPVGLPQNEHIRVHILDENGEPVRDGELGELCYENPYFRGYIGREEETEHILRNGVLHSGDLCRRLSDGTLQLAGRNDDMVKIHGLQVRTAEIEKAVLRCCDAQQAVVRCLTESTRVFICVYYTGKADISPEDARAKLRGQLPVHMVPTHFIRLERIPTNRNGKVDIQKLPLPAALQSDRGADDEASCSAGNTANPSADDTENSRACRQANPSADDTENRKTYRQANPGAEAVPDWLEEEITGIIRGVLNDPEPVGKDNNLLSLGMSSLTAILLIGEIEERFKVRLTLAEIMEHPDINHICEKTRRAIGSGMVRTGRTTGAAGRGDYLPLSKNQLAVFAQCEANKNSVQYNIPAYFSFPRSEMDPELLKAALWKSADLHRVFSTRIVRRKEVPVTSQIPGCEIYQTHTDGTVVIGYTRLENSFNNEKQEKVYFQGKVIPYDLFKDRLYRIELVETPDRLYLFFDIHHLIADGYSLRILADDITRQLGGMPVLGERLTFTEYLEEKAERSIFEEDDRRYAQTLLDGLKSFRYPYRLQGECDQPHSTARLRKEFAMEAVLEFCRRKNLTQSSYFHASLLLAVYLLTGEKPFIATTYSGRAERPAELMRTVGFFSKSVPIVWNVDKEDPACSLMRPEDYIRGIQAQIMAICSHDKVTYTDLAARTDVLLTFQGELGVSFIGRYRGIDLDLQTPLFPIWLVVRPVGRTYDILLNYDEALFSAADMALLFDSFMICLDRLSKEAAIRDISLTQEEPVSILQRCSGRIVTFEKEKNWVQDFKEQADKAPERLAVSAENGTYTYRELDEISDRVACLLIQNGVSAGDFVVIRMPRVKEFPAAVLGIHKCGAAYVPVDEDYPEHRIAYIIKDSAARIQITQEAIASLELNETKYDVAQDVSKSGICSKSGCREEEQYGAPTDAGESACKTLLLESDLQKNGGELSLAKTDAANRAYMIYTSGSTGDPKGTVISHSALYNYLRYVKDEMKLNPLSRIACYASFSFDISIEGLLVPLIAGGMCVIIPAAIRKNVAELEKYLKENGVTGGCFPTQIGQLLGQREPLDLEYLTLIGEKMTAVPGNRGHIYNAYGPTECTVVCTYYDVIKDRQYADIPIGKPMYNTTVLLLDPFGNLLPDGAVGELCVAGAQLAEGYHNKPEKTARVFGPLPQYPSVRVYHTGDLARRMTDGNLMFIGRADRQFKRNGYRIEPGEIENVAMGLTAVKEVVAIADRNRLILYYTLHETDAAGAADEIRRRMKEELPAYMLPDGYMQLKTMPLTPNGKIDIQKLPEFEFKSTAYVPPVNEAERFVCERMAKILHVKRVGINDDFFDLGGNSLDAVQFAVALGEGFEISDIYNGRTASGILKESREKRRFYGYDRFSVYPLTEEQKKFFFVTDMVACPEISYANVPLLLQLPETADLERLKSMLMQIIDNHPYLKVRYMENPDPSEAAEERYVVRRDDTIPAEVSLIRVQKLDKDKLIRPYNLLGDENMYRVALYETESGEKYLFLDFHHIVIDGESNFILFKDMKMLMAGQKLLPEKVSGFEVALDERRRREEQKEEITAYFRDLLKDCGDWINDWINDRRDIQTLLKRDEKFDEKKGLACVMGSRVVRVMESSVNMKHVRERCRSLHITENMFFNAAFSCLLGECNGKSKALYASVINNRDYEALENTVTMLCRTVPVYLKVSAEELSSDHFLKQLRRVISNAGRAGILSYEEICRLSGIRLPRITLIYYERPFNYEVFPGCRRFSLNTLDSIDTILLKIYHDEDERLFLKFDMSLDFTEHEIDLMAERMDMLIRKM